MLQKSVKPIGQAPIYSDRNHVKTRGDFLTEVSIKARTVSVLREIFSRLKKGTDAKNCGKIILNAGEFSFLLNTEEALFKNDIIDKVITFLKENGFDNILVISDQGSTTDDINYEILGVLKNKPSNSKRRQLR